MSKYLHFGHVSPVWLVLEARKANAKNDDIESFVEELVVRRELSMNFVFYNEDYDSYSNLPDWAKKTLREHKNDEREYVYTRKQLENAETHDEYWNAAMKEMVYTGYMHNYMRMYWGKKILEWSNTPEHAYRTTLYLNNKYFLDGRDPNSFANVAWVFGQHDRGWTEREVYGKVRYMSAGGLERKAKPEQYVEKVEKRIGASELTPEPGVYFCPKARRAEVGLRGCERDRQHRPRGGWAAGEYELDRPFRKPALDHAGRALLAAAFFDGLAPDGPLGAPVLYFLICSAVTAVINTVATLAFLAVPAGIALATGSIEAGLLVRILAIFVFASLVVVAHVVRRRLLRLGAHPARPHPSRRREGPEGSSPPPCASPATRWALPWRWPGYPGRHPGRLLLLLPARDRPEAGTQDLDQQVPRGHPDAHNALARPGDTLVVYDYALIREAMK